MQNYLTKEEIKQWRSSLERITLEEYAQRLGKVINEEKETKDLADIVMKKTDFAVTSVEDYSLKREKIISAAKKSVEMQEKQRLTKSETTSRYTFKKPLTQREQMIFDYFLKNKGEIIYAKDLAKMLELPTDYVYKYIKNLRTKINQNVLQNAFKGGYVFNE